MRLIPDIVRDVPERADMTLEWALAGRGKGVVALGLSGREEHPSEVFREHFDEARRQGLHCVAHAGEHGGPDSIRGVLDACGAERVGHGVAAARDAALLRELATSATPLEVSPTSNVCLGVASDIASHPFDSLYRAGVRLSVNSDDPPFFNTSLSREYQLLADTFGYDETDLERLSMWSLEDSFLPSEDKHSLVQGFAQQFSELREAWDDG